MSFACQRLAVGALNLRALPRSAQSSPVTYRLLSTTSCRSHAQPIHVKHEEPSHGHRLDPPGLKSPRGTGTSSAEDEPEKYLDPYKGGQSAIDKAVHLFFFTEILRGASLVTEVSEQHLMIVFRHVDCDGEFLPVAIHYPVPIREGSTFTPFSR